MKEISEILNAYSEANAAGKKTALATVVKVEGSSYRQPGARMLVTEDGLLTGAISGGCLEGDLSPLPARGRGSRCAALA